MSNKEKERFKKIESEISSKEAEVEDIQTKLGKLDFAANDPEVTKTFEKLDQKLKKGQKKLEDLFAEWEILESKNI